MKKINKFRNILILIIIIPFFTFFIFAFSLLINKDEGEKQLKCETPQEIIKETIKIIYKDIIEREEDIHGCPVDFDYINDDEYERCSKAKQLYNFPDQMEDTEFAKHLFDELPHCAFNMFPNDMACAEGDYIKLPEPKIEKEL